MVYKRVRGKTSARSLPLKNFVGEDAPGEQVISDIKDTMLYITQILRLSAEVGSRKYVIYLTSNNY